MTFPIAHGVLTDRDDELVRTEAWAAQQLATIERAEDRRLLATYATWRVLRRLRARSGRAQSPRTAIRHARNQLTTAIALLDWLAVGGLTLAQARQGDIDTWLTTGPGAHQARDFLGWAAEHGHWPPLTITPATSATGTTMDPDQRLEQLARLLHDDTLELTDRVAGSLLLAYAQPLSRITAITLDQIGRDATSHVATIRFGNDDIVLQQPLASLIGELIDTPRAYVGIRAPADNPWLFPGGQPGRPLTAARLGARLGKLGIDARAGRRAALIHLAAHLPAAVLADLLHLTPGTAVRWVNNAGGDWPATPPPSLHSPSPPRRNSARPGPPPHPYPATSYIAHYQFLAAGVPVKVVSERLGHANVTVTLAIYAHVLPGDDEKAAAKVAAAILTA